MKLSQKKKCGECRALDPTSGDCSLQFKARHIPYNHRFPVDEYAPTEPCYKPLTYDDYFKAKILVADGD